MPLLVEIAKWTGAVCGVLALPFAAIALIFAAYLGFSSGALPISTAFSLAMS